MQELAEFNHAVEAVIKVSDLNRNKAQFMGDGKRDQISDAELAACAEATILNEQLEERGRIGGPDVPERFFRWWRIFLRRNGRA